MKSCGNHKLAGDGPETRLAKQNRTTDLRTVMVNDDVSGAVWD
jgi:hypothetical protein